MVISLYSNDTFAETSTDGIAPCEALRFLLNNADRNVHLLLPAHSGYVIQSDFLERRMVDCPYVTKVQSLVSPGQQLQRLQSRDIPAHELLRLAFSQLRSHCYLNSNDESPLPPGMATTL